VSRSKITLLPFFSASFNAQQRGGRSSISSGANPAAISASLSSSAYLILFKNVPKGSFLSVPIACNKRRFYNLRALNVNTFPFEIAIFFLKPHFPEPKHTIFPTQMRKKGGGACKCAKVTQGATA
jgi:hypothetical protein